MVVKINVSWNKKQFEVEVAADDTGAKLKEVLAGLTGVPVARQKLMAKGAWPGVLKDEGSLGALKEGHKVMLMGSAETLAALPVKFLEDMTQVEQAATGAVMPAGFVNLGNTCYMNSTLQCLRAIPELRQGLEGSANRGDQGLATALHSTYRDLDRSTEAAPPALFVQALRSAFPQFAQRGRNGGFAQQDAEELYSALLGDLAQTLGGGGGSSSFSSSDESLIDRLFGLDLDETLTCAETDAEEPVVKRDAARKLVCMIQGGQGSTQKVDHLYEGLKLSLTGSLTKNSAVLGRDAAWLKTQTIAKLPPYLCVQFMRFFWKATPDSQDHAGVKCKIMRPISFPETLDVFAMCSPKLQALLSKNRAKYGAKLEDLPTADKKEEEEKPEVADEAAAAAAPKTMDVDSDDDLANDALKKLGLPDKFMGNYELFALVTHKGRSADGGHYIGWVRNDAKRWIVFDDEDVSDSSTEFIMNLKGGGDEHMAYLAFYRAKGGNDSTNDDDAAKLAKA